MVTRLIQNRYRVLERIGRGGMGSVYKAQDIHEDGRIVALKRIGIAEGEFDKLPSLRREFRTLLQLHHPNLAEVYDFGDIREQREWFFTSEYIEGTDLLEAAEEMDWDTFLEAVVQICHALEYIHSRDIIHNDVKPRNILVRSDRSTTPWIKIVDFGLSAEGAAKQGGMIQGTVHYMAPEIIRGDAVDGRADIYSLGATLYHVVTRRPPFIGDTNISVIRQHLHAEPPSPEELRPDIPPPIARMILRLLEKFPADRLQTANEVVREINRFSTRKYPTEPEEAAGALLRSCFVGRSLELESLKKVLPGRSDPATGGHDGTTLVLVEAQAGMGKSRFVREFQVECQVEGVPFLHGRSFEEGEHVYGPLAEVIQQLLPVVESVQIQRGMPGGSGQVVGRYRSELERIVPELAYGREPPPPPAAEEEKIAFHDRLARFFVEALEGTQVVLHFSELHWAHESTLEFIEYLAGLAGRQRFVILGSYRPEDVAEGPAGDRLRRLAGREFTRLIRLGGIRLADIALLAQSMLGTKAIPDGLIDYLVKTTGGNPFFIEVAMRELVEKGTLGYEGGRWSLRTEETEGMAAPGLFRDSITRRIEKVSEPQTHILEALAVWERPATSEWVQAVGQFEPLLLHADLHALEREGLLHREHAEGQLRFSFSHSLIREVTYDGIVENERRRIHGRIARLLGERARRSSADVMEDLAHHAARSAEPEKAVPYLKAAGDRSRQVHAYEAAIEYYEEALALAGPDDAGERLALLGSIGVMQQRLGNYGEAEEVIRRRLDLAGRRGEGRAVARGHQDLAELMRLRGDPSGAREHAEKALELFEEAGDHQGVAGCHHTLGHIHWNGGRLEPAIECFEKCLAAHQETNDTGQVASALSQLGVLHWSRGEYGRALECHEEALSMREAAGDRPGQAESHYNIGRILRLRGDYPGALEAHGKSLQIRRDIGNPLEVAMSLDKIGRVHGALGEYGLALEACAESLRIGGRLRHRQRIAAALASIARVHMTIADIPLASHLQGQALALSRESEDRRLEAALLCDAGTVRLLNEDPIEARALFLQAAEIAREIGEREVEALARHGLARIDVADGRLAEARAAGREIFQTGRDLESPRLVVLGLLVRGEAKLHHDEADDAMTDLREAVKVATKLGDPEILWQACHLAGRAASERDDLDGAARLYSRALASIHDVAAHLDDDKREPFLTDPRKWRFREDALALGTRIGTPAVEPTSGDDSEAPGPAAAAPPEGDGE